MGYGRAPYFFKNSVSPKKQLFTWFRINKNNEKTYFFKFTPQKNPRFSPTSYVGIPTSYVGIPTSYVGTKICKPTFFRDFGGYARILIDN